MTLDELVQKLANFAVIVDTSEYREKQKALIREFLGGMYIDTAETINCIDKFAIEISKLQRRVEELERVDD